MKEGDGMAESFSGGEPRDLSPEEIISRVAAICRKYEVQHLYLFGSYAEGKARPDSDLDFVVKGGISYEEMQEEIDAIPTLKKIDLFRYDHIRNAALKEDMDLYGKEVY